MKLLRLPCMLARAMALGYLLVRAISYRGQAPADADGFRPPGLFFDT